MEQITLRFSGMPSFQVLFPEYEVVLKMDENGKYATMEIDDNDYFPEDIKEKIEKSRPVELPKRVMKAFTERVIDKILSMDELPDADNAFVLDGNSYTIIITKGDLTKVYDANDCTIETYPLLRYLASWYRREMGL